MNSPPAARPAVEEARGASTRSRNTPNPNYVRVLNPVSNGTGIFKCKKADYYVNKGRAKWVDKNHSQLRLVPTHPKNIEAARRACALDRAYDSIACDFDMFIGMSGGETVVKIARAGGRAT